MSNEDELITDNKSTSSITADAMQDKKSDTIEIRLPYQDKKAFVAACKSQNRSVSAALREAISLYLQHGHFVFPPSGMAEKHAAQKGSFRMIIAGFIAGGLATATLFTVFEQKTPDYGPFAHSYFEKLDHDKDGEISLPEYISAVKKASGFPQMLPKASVGSYYLHNAELKLDNVLNSPDQSVQRQTEGLFSITNFDQACQGTINDIAIAQHTYEHALLDTNDDQKLSLREFSRSQLLPNIDRIHAEHRLFDSDNSGDISFDEFRDAFNGDKNGAYAIDYRFHQTIKLPEICREALGENASLSLRNSYDLNYGAIRLSTDIEQLFNAIDINRDRRLTKQEFMNRILALI